MEENSPMDENQRLQLLVAYLSKIMRDQQLIKATNSVLLEQLSVLTKSDLKEVQSTVDSRTAQMTLENIQTSLLTIRKIVERTFDAPPDDLETFLRNLGLH